MRGVAGDGDQVVVEADSQRGVEVGALEVGVPHGSGGVLAQHARELPLPRPPVGVGEGDEGGPDPTDEGGAGDEIEGTGIGRGSQRRVGLIAAGRGDGRSNPLVVLRPAVEHRVVVPGDLRRIDDCVDLQLVGLVAGDRVVVRREVAYRCDRHGVELPDEGEGIVARQRGAAEAGAGFGAGGAEHRWGGLPASEESSPVQPPSASIVMTVAAAMTAMRPRPGAARRRLIGSPISGGGWLARLP